ncbi:MAG: pyridoxal-dependent decarboxylase [Actinomycetota bacterium]|nr:pyridoxal-dependent decarboxylase [Actinomycetota bacterium]
MSVHPLEPERDVMETLGHAALEFSADFIEARASAPASDVDDAGWRLAEDLIGTPPPETGRDFAELLNVIDAASAKAFDTTGPGYMAFIPGGGLYAAAIASLLAAVTNRYVNIAAPAPAMVAIEASVVRWLCGLFGYGEESQGILTSGGSMANFSAVVAARAHHLGEGFLDGTLYVTEHTHQSVAKAALLAGFPPGAIRTVPSKSDLTMDADALVDAVKADRSAGRRPFLVVASAGTVDTGAVDSIGVLVDVARAEDLWLHIDAAYGGFFQLTDRGRALFAGIEKADSITLDPHKGMFLPYGTGCLLVRNGELLRRSHRVEAHYLQDLAEDHRIPNFADYSPELSRDFRGLRVWLPLHLHGVSAFRAALDEKLDLARVVYEGLSAENALEVPWDPSLSIVAFRLRDGDGSANRALLDRINATARVFLSSTVVDGRFTMRVCVLAHRTHRDRIDETIEIIRKEAAVA